MANSTELLCNKTYSALGRDRAVSATYLTLTSIMSALSICGASIIIKTILTIPGLRTPGRMFLVYLSGSDLLLAVGNLSSVIWWMIVTEGDSDRTALNNLNQAANVTCKAQAAVTSTASLTSFFWTSIIALNIYLTVVRQNKCLTTSLRALPHILCWGVPLCILSVTLAYDRYGLNTCTGEMVWWCWIQPAADNLPVKVWQLISGKLWELISYVFVGILYAAVVLDISTHVKRMRSHSQKTSNASGCKPLPSSNTTAFIYANKKLIFVPLVFIIARIWGTIRFFLDFGDSVEVQTAAAIFAPIQGLGDSAQGFLNCVVFIFTTPSIRDRLPFHRLRNIFRTSQSDNPPKVEQNDFVSSTSSFATTDHAERHDRCKNYGTMESSNGTVSNIRATDTSHQEENSRTF